MIGITPNGRIARTINDAEAPGPMSQIVIDDEFGPIGPGGARALMTSVMGTGPGMKGGPYKLLKSIRIWRSYIGDEGAAAIAEVLRLGGAEVQLNYLELFDDGIGPKGALALGQSLAAGKNVSLATLKLDYNACLGGEGVITLCRGLRTNISLMELHLAYCMITYDAGPALAEVLANAKSALEVLNLTGNRLGGIGLSAICKGLAVNHKLDKFQIGDNMIDQSDEDMLALADFRDCLFNPQSGMTKIDLMYNRIGEKGALVLAPALGSDNTKVKEFLVDLTLPMSAFDMIFRRDAGGKKGKKGKKKSDFRLKENIHFLRKDARTGLNIYEFNYIDSVVAQGDLNVDVDSDRAYITEVGVMAQEVLTAQDGKYQSAVILDEDGYYSVDYNVLELDL